MSRLSQFLFVSVVLVAVVSYFYLHDQDFVVSLK